MGIKTGKEAFEQVQGSLKKQWDELIPESVPKPEISTVGDALKAPEYGLTKISLVYVLLVMNQNS